MIFGQWNFDSIGDVINLTPNVIYISDAITIFSGCCVCFFSLFINFYFSVKKRSDNFSP